MRRHILCDVASDATGEIDHLPQKLTPESRILSGAVGVLSIAAGVFAIFYKNNNGGSIALVVVGAAFLLMAITGYGVRSLKIGPNEIVMDTLNVARQLRLQGDDEGAAEAIESLIKTPTPLLTQPVADTSLSQKLPEIQPLSDRLVLDTGGLRQRSPRGAQRGTLRARIGAP